MSRPMRYNQNLLFNTWLNYSPLNQPDEIHSHGIVSMQYCLCCTSFVDQKRTLGQNYKKAGVLKANSFLKTRLLNIFNYLSLEQGVSEYSHDLLITCESQVLADGSLQALSFENLIRVQSSQSGCVHEHPIQQMGKGVFFVYELALSRCQSILVVVV